MLGSEGKKQTLGQKASDKHLGEKARVRG